MAESREDNPERQRQWQKSYNERHPGRKTEHSRASKIRHNEEIKRKSKERYWNNPEARREYANQWRLRNLEKVRARGRELYVKNCERRKAESKLWNKEHFFYERARKFTDRYGALPGAVTAFDLWKLWKAQRGICSLTGREMEPRKHNGVALDHIMPVKLGGKTETRNLRWLCHEANAAKATMTDDQFKKLCLDVLSYDEMPITEKDYQLPHWAKEYRECGIGI